MSLPIFLLLIVIFEPMDFNLIFKFDTDHVNPQRKHENIRVMLLGIK